MGERLQSSRQIKTTQRSPARTGVALNSNPHLTQQPILALQRSIGNRAVQRLVRQNMVETKAMYPGRVNRAPDRNDEQDGKEQTCQEQQELPGTVMILQAGGEYNLLPTNGIVSIRRWKNMSLRKARRDLVFTLNSQSTSKRRLYGLEYCDSAYLGTLASGRQIGINGGAYVKKATPADIKKTTSGRDRVRMVMNSLKRLEGAFNKILAKLEKHSTQPIKKLLKGITQKKQDILIVVVFGIMSFPSPLAAWFSSIMAFIKNAAAFFLVDQIGGLMFLGSENMQTRVSGFVEQIKSLKGDQVIIQASLNTLAETWKKYQPQFKQFFSGSGGAEQYIPGLRWVVNWGRANEAQTKVMHLQQLTKTAVDSVRRGQEKVRQQMSDMRNQLFPEVFGSGRTQGPTSGSG